MKTKLYQLLQDFVRISACFLPVIPAIRIMEYLTLKGLHNLPAGSGTYIFTGLAADFLVFLFISLLSLVPVLLLGLLSRKTARITWMVALTLYALFHFALIRYFSITLVPLDQVIFSYTIKEMVMISVSSSRFTVLAFLPFLLLPALMLACCYLFRNRRPGRFMIIGSLLLFVISPFLLKKLNPKPFSFETDLQYFLAVNKPLYLAQKCRLYIREGAVDKAADRLPDARMMEEFSRYHQYHPEFRFIGPTFPLLHTEETPDVLGGFFNPGQQKPNLVFIIVESLSSAFCGTEPMLGSFTPFLDSLSQKSLYWKDCLTSSERTFYVLPSMFGSLPYGSGMYLHNLTRSSYHLSLIRYLNQHGYSTRFFYGGDPAFNQMDNFLRRNNIGHMLTTWGPQYQAQTKQEHGFKWGYPDHALFRRSFEFIDSLDATPYMDIYLTLSMHAPFDTPDDKKYHGLFRDRLAGMKLDEEQKKEAEKYEDIFSTILYTDDALRSFFSEYRKRPEYGNTIFIITGDHSLPELNTGWYSPMERFRVPFMIFSPLLNTTRTFRSVMTHLDVTPSILAFLRNNYNMETHSMAPWIGVGIDTSQSFRSARSVVFIRNNKEMIDYIDSGYCLSEGRLYKVMPDMRAALVQDRQVRERLQRKLENYTSVTQYVGLSNSLVPIWMMFGKMVTEEPVTITDSLKYSGNFISDGFVTLLKRMSLSEQYNYISLGFSFRFYSQEKDPERLPGIVFEVAGPAGENLVWNQYPLFRPGEYKAGQWNTVRFNEDIDLSYIKDIRKCKVRMYLWNTRTVTFGCDSLSRTIRGFR